MREGFVLAAAVGALACSAGTQRAGDASRAMETRVSVGSISLYARTIGQGRPAIVLHGGPEFDTAYLLPELDQLVQDSFRLVYYDQRGRGKSAVNVRPGDVTLASELDDLDSVRVHFGLDAPVLLGHSWGTVLALEYALRHPDRVSYLVLLNPAPASVSDVGVLRESHIAQLGEDMKAQLEIREGAAYKEGDPAAVAARYRIHFKHGLTRPEHYESLMVRMRAAFERQGKEGIVKARAVEDRLMLETWAKPGYDLLPKLADLRIPTLVIVGEDDFIPREIAARIAAAIPGAVLVNIPNCAHFAYLECPADLRKALVEFFRSAPTEPADSASEGSASLVGDWDIEFTLDSARGGTRDWAPGRAPPVRGRLRIAAGAHQATMDVDFRPLLGRQMSCYEPGPRDVVITPADLGRIYIGFTPAAADCGFGAAFRRTGDRLHGTWSETSFIGPVAEGAVRMTRR